MSVSKGSFRSWAHDPLRPWVGHSLSLTQSVNRNVEWVRSRQSLLNLFQDFSDFFDNVGTHDLGLVGTLVSLVERPAAVSDTLTMTQAVTVAGGHLEAPGLEPVTATFQSLTLVGMALYVPSDGSVDLASASSNPNVVGLAKVDAAPGIGEYITEGQITRSNWSAVAGTATLSPGAYYYLSPSVAGQITSVAPTTPGQSVVVVGRALTQTTLDVEITPPILL